MGQVSFRAVSTGPGSGSVRDLPGGWVGTCIRMCASKQENQTRARPQPCRGSPWRVGVGEGQAFLEDSSRLA
eukprot:4131962-Pyramimonas_sp.AAC.1